MTIRSNIYLICTCVNITLMYNRLRLWLHSHNCYFDFFFFYTQTLADFAVWLQINLGLFCFRYNSKQLFPKKNALNIQFCFSWCHSSCFGSCNGFVIYWPLLTKPVYQSGLDLSLGLLTSCGQTRELWDWSSNHLRSPWHTERGIFI